MQTPTPLTKTLTLTALTALLLTGCGQKEVGSIPDAPTSTTASASADNTAGDSTPNQSQGAEAEASTEDTQHYSGGSKAPEGEYRPADEQGPAQNVPVPKRPDGMNVESAEGLEKFIGYWNDSVNYGIQTGNFTYAKSLVSEDYTSEHEFYIWADEIYNRGGWIVGARREAIIGEGLLVSHGEGLYTWGGNLNVEDMQSYLDGPGAISDGSFTRGQGIYFEVLFSNGKWEMQGVEVVDV